jgi:CheY-like chemotaxis protein
VKTEQDYDERLSDHRPLQDCKGGGLQVLLVEDSLSTAEGAAIFLRYHGHRVQLATDGPSACQLALRTPPDVVLLDLSLPGMDGWEVARCLQEQTWQKKPFLIAITRYDREADRRRSFEAGIDLHLVKPVDPHFLRRLLERFRQVPNAE